MLKILILILEEIISFFFKTKIYDIILDPKKNRLDKKIPASLENFYYFDNSYQYGHSVLDNTFYLANSYHKINSFKEDLSLLSQHALNEFATLKWLYHLKALQTNIASKKSLSLILLWCQHNNKYHTQYWQLDILSDRVFAMITNYSFLIKTASPDEQRLIYNYIYKQIKHIGRAYKYTFNSNNLKVAKALFAAYLFCNKSSKILSNALEAFNNAINIQVLRDGGDISRNPEISLNNLEDILSIYYILKDNGYQDLTKFRELIDKITVFIRSIKVPDGLPIFQGGSTSTNKQVTYLLSLSKVSTAISSLLRDSKYLIIKQNNFQAVMDVGPSQCKEGSVGSLELWYKNNKIFGNLNADFKNNIIHPALINYGIVVKKHNKHLTRLMTDNTKFLKYERKEEDVWNIFKIQYGALEELGFIYHSTMYFSKKNVPCVLGENLLTVKNILHFQNNFQEVFLNIPLSTNIEYFKYSKDKQGVGFRLPAGDKDKFIFKSQETPLLLKNLSYNENKTNKLQSSYNIFIHLDISKPLIKNSWTLQQII